MNRRRVLFGAVAGVALVAAVLIAVSGVLATTCGNAGAAVGCATPSSLSPAEGVSVVTGYGHLTGVVRHRFGTPLHEFEITKVRVSAGPARVGPVRGWLATVPSAGSDVAAAQVPGLWAPDGRVLAYVSPRSTRATEASTLRIRPIVHDQVVFSAADCGSAPVGLATTKFGGSLAEVPGSRSSTVARCNGGFMASRLSVVRQLLH